MLLYLGCSFLFALSQSLTRNVAVLHYPTKPIDPLSDVVLILGSSQPNVAFLRYPTQPLDLLSDVFTFLVLHSLMTLSYDILRSLDLLSVMVSIPCSPLLNSLFATAA